ncbi:hypothetical protein FDJ13_gp56 [Gordonia phage Gustav]|uniref:Uncharacterized protein n=1 Tax=Gordonia phage Gustav TaxID=2047872 RepID=A0A2H4PA60_9CAUD|nr:hypothetical protein FDJ13_gp56 [Gordonia phage Gustav]ATW59116.1 hypothetical protein PHIRE_GUSTAV_56 [Gordonia phage Gustav]
MTNWLDKLFPPNDPVVRAAMEQRIYTDEIPTTEVWNNPLLAPPTRLYAALDHLEERTALHDEVQAVRDAVAEWWASAEHRDHVHVNPNVVAAALERQERERGRELDDLLAALDVELLPWQRDTLGRWLERKLTFRMR